MFSVLPSVTVLFVEALAALLPAFFLLRYIYRQDKVEKEPPRLLRQLFWMGCLSAVCALILELVANQLLDAVVDPADPRYIYLLAFLVIAAVEEGAKLWFLHRRTWDERHFNYRFDGIVYAVFVSLGFAALENILYILGNGLSVALPRALLAVPAHMGFGVFMGYFYSRARLRKHRRKKRGVWVNMSLGYLSAMFLHGFYDACALKGTPLATAMFVVFVAAMYKIVYHMVTREAESDMPV